LLALPRQRRPPWSIGIRCRAHEIATGNAAPSHGHDQQLFAEPIGQPGVGMVRRWSILNRFYSQPGACYSNKRDGERVRPRHSQYPWRLIMKKLSVLAIIVGGALLAAAPFSFQWSPEKNVVLSLDRADARVGRPLTATSVAGVHRRAERRAYRRGY
jgi:hypothetical protein